MTSSPETMAVMAEATAWLERDDELSLERASARFADAAELSPEAPGPLVFQSLAEGLLAASLVAELREYEAELARRNKGGDVSIVRTSVQAEPLVAQRISSEELIARSSALRLRADVHLSRAWAVGARAEAATAVWRERQGLARDDSVLPRALARIVSGEADKAKALLESAPGETRIEALGTVVDAKWAQLIRGLLAEAMGERNGEAAGEGAHEDPLAAAAEAGLVRAAVELAGRELERREQARGEPDSALPSPVVDVKRLLDAVLERSPEHERALRLSATLAEQALARGVAEGH